MKRRISFTLLGILMAIVPVLAQVTSSPTPLQEGSKNVVLTYKADSPAGNKGLANLPSSTAVYAHIGVITSKSTGDSDWKYVVAPWPTSASDSKANTAKNKLTYTAANTYTLEIGDIRTYFGITNSTETVKKIAVVFRTADGNKKGKTASDGDIFIDVLPDGFQMTTNTSYTDATMASPNTVSYSISTTLPADLTLSVNGTAFASRTAATELSGVYSFKEVGKYTVEAKAVHEGKTYTKTYTIDYVSAADSETYPGGIPKPGAVKNSDGSVTFCFPAPEKNNVTLVGSWNDYSETAHPMKQCTYQNQTYFWTTVTGLENDQYYYYFYIVDGKYKVGDPYATLVADCYNDNSISRAVWGSGNTMPKHPGSRFANIMMGIYRGDMLDYEFSKFNIPAHDHLMVYEILFRDFTTAIDGSANASGNIRRAMEKIPYIKEMGFNAIEIMPVMEFNGNNSWGYNTNFYFALDKAYGSPRQFQDFVEECHKNGIAVILDIVFNQSDGLHPWYQMYPIDTNPFYNKVSPHSWSVLNDWRQDNALVQRQWDDCLRFWMEKYNVDGFRFDLVKGLGDNGSYGAGTEAYNQSRVDRMKRLHSVITSVKKDGIHINELLGGADEEKQLGNDGQIQWGNINNASCEYAMGHDSGDRNLYRFSSADDGGRPWGSTLAYAESHDEQRMGWKCVNYGVDAVKTDTTARYNRLAQLAVQMLLTPGPKMVWQFGEFGDDQNEKEKEDGSGSNNTSPKICDWRWLQDEHKLFLHDTYATLINLRKDNPELFYGNTGLYRTNLGAQFNRKRVFRLVYGDKEVVAFINPAATGAAINVDEQCAWMTKDNARLLCASKGFTPTLNGSGNNLSVTVPANGFAIYTKDVASSGIYDTPVVDANAAPAVYGGEGEIIIAGQYSNVQVYNTSGTLMPGLQVLAGYYIVVVDGTPSKVAVK